MYKDKVKKVNLTNRRKHSCSIYIYRKLKKNLKYTKIIKNLHKSKKM